jgi:hypothetical protein
VFGIKLALGRGPVETSSHACDVSWIVVSIVTDVSEVPLRPCTLKMEAESAFECISSPTH